MRPGRRSSLNRPVVQPLFIRKSLDLGAMVFPEITVTG